MPDYLSVIYNYKTRPETNYPEKLVQYLCESYNLTKDSMFLEAGCGRGEHLRLFQKNGLNVRGFDISPESLKISPDLGIDIVDIETDILPYDDNTFDIIYSKSFLEHLYYPEKFMQEAYRVLKPKGVLLSLVPDWESNYKIYFDDYTHRTPFTKESLSDIYNIFGLNNVKVKKFRQLPITWKYPFINGICRIISPLIPVRTKIKAFKWSRELMLIAVGYKNSNVSL